MRYLLSASLVSACLLLAACSGSEVKGNGKVVTQNRDINTVTQIETSGEFLVRVNANESNPSLQVKVDENLQPYVMTTQHGNLLKVSVKKGFILEPTTPVQIMLNTNKLVSATVNGKTTFVANKVSVNHFHLVVNGQSAAILKGETEASKINVNGAGEVNASGFKSEDVNIMLNGSGKASVFASHQLKVYIKGEGQVTYAGKPPIIAQEIYGGGKLINAGAGS